MANPQAEFDVDPVRPGAAPTIDTVTSGLTAGRTLQPAWVRMTEALVKWIRFHFSVQTRIEHPQLVDRVWTSSPSSPIFISSLAEWSPNQSQQRPSILIDRLDQDKDLARRGIGDQLQGIAPGRFSHFMSGQHVVHCLGGREGEAELLAFEVWRDLSRFAPVLREVLCLHRLMPYRIGKRVQLSAEHKEHYSVPVVVSYYYEEAWRLTVLDEDEVTAIKTTLAGI